MGIGYRVNGNAQFKAYISVQANASTSMTLKLGNNTVDTATTDTNGVCAFTVKKKGIYTLVNPHGLSINVTVERSGQTYDALAVYVTPPTNLTVFGYKTGTTGVYWADEKAGNTCSGSLVRMSTSGYPQSYSEGESAYAMGATRTKINKTVTESGNGFTKSISSGVTQYYSRFNYLLVNGNYYYSAAHSDGSYTYKTYSGSASYSASGTFTVPEGIRSLSVFCVGGGGGGAGASGYTGSGSGYSGGGGGGGGYASSGSFNVTPGQNISFTVGAGGAAGDNGRETSRGGDGGQTNFSSVSANGGGGGYFNGALQYNDGGAGGNSGGRGGKGGGSFGRGSDGGSNNVSHGGVYYSGGGGGGGGSGSGTSGGNRGGGGGAYSGGGAVRINASGGVNGTGGGGGGGNARYDVGNPYGYPAGGGSGAIVISY